MKFAPIIYLLFLNFPLLFLFYLCKYNTKNQNINNYILRFDRSAGNKEKGDDFYTLLHKGNISKCIGTYKDLSKQTYIYGNKLNNVSLDVVNNHVNTNLVIKDNEIGNGINIRSSTKLNKLLINDNLIGNLTLDFAGASTSNITNYTNLYSVKNNFKLSDLSEYILV